MSKIYYLMGKSSSGKDTIYKELRARFPELRTVTLYTTRPAREGEREGVEYHFVDENRLAELEAQGRVIELRAYDTVFGVWKYFTVDDGQFQTPGADFLMIGTLESYEKMKEYFGANMLVPLYIEVEDGERLARALARERTQKNPGYEELCRRFIADAADFSEENLKKAQIFERYENVEMEEVLRKISEKIQNCRKKLD